MSRWAAKDITECNKLAQAEPEGVRRACLVALLSVQQSWSHVPVALSDVIHNGGKSQYLWGWKRTAYKFLDKGANLDYLYSGMMTASNEFELLDLFTTVPGLGLAKAGFVCQLTRGWVGCIDSHNARRYDVAAAQLRYPKGLTIKTQAIKLQGYLDLCEKIGGSEYLWREWCYLMAGRYPQKYARPEDVSTQHVQVMEQRL